MAQDKIGSTKSSRVLSKESPLANNFSVGMLQRVLRVVGVAKPGVGFRGFGWIEAGASLLAASFESFGFFFPKNMARHLNLEDDHYTRCLTRFAQFGCSRRTLWRSTRLNCKSCHGLTLGSVPVQPMFPTTEEVAVSHREWLN